LKKENNVTKHIHGFKSLLEQFSMIGAFLQDDEVILSLMRSMPLIFLTFISSLKRQHNLAL
jgi:hypothetical protein